MRPNRFPAGALLAGITLSSALTLAATLGTTPSATLGAQLAVASHAEGSAGHPSGDSGQRDGQTTETTSPTTTRPHAGSADRKEPGATAATLSLACTSSPGIASTISCTWSQSHSPTFAHYYLLKIRSGFRGRVADVSSDRSTTTFVDHHVVPATFVYVVIAVDGANHVVDHSSVVTVTLGSDPVQP